MRDILIPALLAAVAAPAAAQAQGAPGQWSVRLTPYAWATGLGATVQPFPGAPTVRVSKSFGDLLGDLDAAFFLAGSARRDRLVFVGDVSHSSSSRNGRLPVGVGPLPAGLPAEARVRQTSVTLAGGWRVAETPEASLDLLVGARLWFLRGAVAVPAAGLSATPDQSFVDPIVAARGEVAVAPRLSLAAYGDVGGFGVGSHVTSQLAATLNYDVSARVRLSAGYRHLHVDYRGDTRLGPARIDAAMSGPLVGVGVNF